MRNAERDTRENSFLGFNSIATQVPFEPLVAIQSMVTRKDYSGHVWGPNQRITVDQGLTVATINGASVSLPIRSRTLKLSGLSSAETRVCESLRLAHNTTRIFSSQWGMANALMDP
jgi:hypothetical protein